MPQCNIEVYGWIYHMNHLESIVCCIKKTHMLFIQMTQHRGVIWRLTLSSSVVHSHFNTLRPRQNGRHFTDDTFEHIFFNENVWISIEIPLKFVPKGPINNIPALVKIMAWRGPGDKPLCEPMMARLPTHICVSLPQWVKQITLCDVAAIWVPTVLCINRIGPGVPFANSTLGPI